MQTQANGELIYDMINGFLEAIPIELPGNAIVEDEFKPGSPCFELYAQVYEANRRLCGRLGVNEDEDVELVIDNLLQIGKHLSLKMFRYGIALSAKRPLSEDLRDCSYFD